MQPNQIRRLTRLQGDALTEKLSELPLEDILGIMEMTIAWLNEEVTTINSIVESHAKQLHGFGYEDIIDDIEEAKQNVYDLSSLRSTIAAYMRNQFGDDCIPEQLDGYYEYRQVFETVMAKINASGGDSSYLSSFLDEL